MTGVIKTKKIPLGEGWNYIESVKPKIHSLYILRRYMEHECPRYLDPITGRKWTHLNGSGHLVFGEMICSQCTRECSIAVLEKGMTILGMRVCE